MKKLFLYLALVGAFWAPASFAKTFLIYSVAQDLPMGTDGQVIKKNFYVNIGGDQGVRKGTILNVFRIVSLLNPYDNRKRMNYKVKVGELKVFHVNNEAAIASLHKMQEEDLPVMELDQFIVGDHVAVNTD